MSIAVVTTGAGDNGEAGGYIGFETINLRGLIFGADGCMPEYHLRAPSELPLTLC